MLFPLPARGSSVLPSLLLLLAPAMNSCKQTPGASVAEDAGTTLAHRLDVVPADVARRGCTGKPPSRGCDLLAEFDKAEYFTDFPDAGSESLWVGVSYAIDGNAGTKDDVFIARFGRDGSGFWMDADGIFPKTADQTAATQKLLSVVQAGQTLSAVERDRALSAAVLGNMASLDKTDGVSSMTSRQGQGTYVRQKGKRLLIAEYLGAPTDRLHAPGPTALAWIAEVWPVR